jgi:hypothetical protein
MLEEYVALGDARKIMVKDNGRGHAKDGKCTAGILHFPAQHGTDTNPDLRERLAKTILNHHKKWRTFRASLRALYAIDPEIRVARLAQRARQIDAITTISVEAGREPLSRSRIYCNLLILEAICDSIADGNLQILKIRESEMFQILVENIGRLGAD